MFGGIWRECSLRYTRSESDFLKFVSNFYVITQTACKAIKADLL